MKADIDPTKPRGYVYASYCQPCVFREHPEMLTGYSLRLHVCDRCKRKGVDCAIVRKGGERV